MSKVILHIGTHKTATTTIQDMFAHNADLLAQHGVIYPLLGRTAGHHGLVMDWNQLPKIYDLPGGSIANLRRIAEDHATGDATVFLSSEEFSRGRKGARVDFTAVRAALAGFDEIEVTCVLREQWQFLQSIYLEVSKSRIPPRPPQFVAAFLQDDMAEGLWTDYNRLYDHLLESFAPEEITFFDYAACCRAEGGILGHFLAYLGVPVTVDTLEKVNDGHSNASPPALPTWAANIVSEPHIAPAWLIDATTGAFGAQFGDKAKGVLWTRDEIAMFQSYADERNGRLAGRLAAVQPGFALQVSAPGPADIHREDLRADFWMRSNRWTFASIRLNASA